MAQRKSSGREGARIAMTLAREIARKGESLGWTDVLRDLDAAAAVSLKLWATAEDVDELNRLCEASRFVRRVDGALRGKARGKIGREMPRPKPTRKKRKQL